MEFLKQVPIPTNSMQLVNDPNCFTILLSYFRPIVASYLADRSDPFLLSERLKINLSKMKSTPGAGKQTAFKNGALNDPSVAFGVLGC